MEAAADEPSKGGDTSAVWEVSTPSQSRSAIEPGATWGGAGVPTPHAVIDPHITIDPPKLNY